MTRRAFRAPLGGCLLFFAISGCGPPAPVEVTVLPEEGAVEFPAVVRSAAFSGSVEEMGGYHLIVWSGGSSVGKSLFEALVSDVAVLDALESLGAVPGDALPLSTWEDRDDPSSWRPSQVIQGPPIAVLVKVSGRERPLELHEFLDDSAESGFEMRLGGHRANIPEWRSGCITCLYSCPGSKVGNASYTVRDYVDGTIEITVRPGVLPKDGTKVVIRLELLEPPPEVAVDSREEK